MSYHCNLLEWLTFKGLIMPNYGERESTVTVSNTFSYTDGKMQNVTVTEKQFGSSLTS